MKTANGFLLACALWVATWLATDSSFADHGYVGIAVLPALVLMGVIIGQMMALAAKIEQKQ